MRINELTAAVEQSLSDASASDIARIVLLLTLKNLPAESLSDRRRLLTEIQDVQLQLQFAMDQNAAVAEELDQLAQTEPCEFSPSHVWTLIRAIKVQSQIVQMYLDSDALQEV